MDRITANGAGVLQIPIDGLDPATASTGGEWVVEATETGIVLHRAALDVRRVYLEATRRCNLHCITCVRHTWSDPAGDMDRETFARILDQLRDLPDLKEVYFGGFGEPLFHPNIVEMVRQVKALGVRVMMSTNGVPLNSRMAEALVDAGLDQIVVSFDAVEPRTFRDIRVGADLGRVRENVARLHALRQQRRRNSPYIGIEFVAMRSNVDQLPALPELVRSVGATYVLVTHLLPYTRAMANEILYDGNATGWPASADWEWWAAGHGFWGSLDKPRARWGAARSCRFVEGRSLVVGWDGAVSPCYALMHSYPYFVFGRPKQVTRHVLGNVRQDTLARIWTSSEYVKFRARVRAFNFPSCVDCGPQSCDYSNRNEDCWGNNPSCADCLWAQDIIRCP